MTRQLTVNEHFAKIQVVELLNIFGHGKQWWVIVDYSWHYGNVKTKYFSV